MARIFLETKELLEEYTILFSELRLLIKEIDRMIAENNQEIEKLRVYVEDADLRVESLGARIREVREKHNSGELSQEAAKATAEKLEAELEGHRETHKYLTEMSKENEAHTEILQNKMSVVKTKAEALNVLGMKLNERTNKIPIELNRASIWNWASIGLMILGSAFLSLYLVQSQEGLSGLVLLTSVIVGSLSTVGMYQSSKTKAKAKSELSTIKGEFDNLMKSLDTETGESMS